MKTLHCLIAGLRPTFSNVAASIAIPSLALVAALSLAQPCAGFSLQFQETGSLAFGHVNAPATLLADGRVVIAGGDGADFNSPIADAELYNPASGTWSTTGSLNAARNYHKATLLADGKVLVAGGFGTGGGLLATTELYDPTIGTWSVSGSLVKPRWAHTATLLADGGCSLQADLSAMPLCGAQNFMIL